MEINNGQLYRLAALRAAFVHDEMQGHFGLALGHL